MGAVRKGLKYTFFNGKNRRDIRAEHSEKKVVCVETGRIFKSGTKCAAVMKISTSSISKSCRTEAPIKGFTFKLL